jgi:two-component system nitrate/nitrite response regulator NarL
VLVPRLHSTKSRGCASSGLVVCIFNSSSRVLRKGGYTPAYCLRSRHITQQGIEGRVLINVFIVSNFQLLLHGIEVLLSQHGERFHLVGKAEQLDGLSEAVVSIRPDLLVLDIDTAPTQVPMQVEVLNTVASHVRILLLTRLSGSKVQDKAVMAGARGLIDYKISLDLFLNAMEKVHEGQIWLDRDSTGRLWGSLSSQPEIEGNGAAAALVEQLSGREKKILFIVLSHGGESAKEIAARLFISESTLRNHLTSIYKKCRVSNRSGLLLYALKNRLIERLEAEFNSSSARW